MSKIVETYNFTNANLVGRIGPTQVQLDAIYDSTNLKGLVTSINGIQRFTIPEEGYYNFKLGGSKSGRVGTASQGREGYGAVLDAEFLLSAGMILYVLVGQPSQDKSWSDWGAGGGGATFVAYLDELNGTQSSALGVKVSPLIIAAGAGGPMDNMGISIGGSGNAETSGTGEGGTNGSIPGGGGGFIGNGGGSGYGGTSFINGGYGGSANWVGGFGGGGAPYDGGGGGGGYTGGNAPNNNTPGLGGYSYIRSDARSIIRTSGGNQNTGFLTINYMSYEKYIISDNGINKYYDPAGGGDWILIQ